MTHLPHDTEVSTMSNPEDVNDDSECCCSKVFPCDPDKPCTCCQSCYEAAGDQCAAPPVEEGRLPS